MQLQELIRRWDSERELLHSAPWKLPEFAEITQNNGQTGESDGGTETAGRPVIIEADCSVTGESDSGSELVS